MRGVRWRIFLFAICCVSTCCSATEPRKKTLAVVLNDDEEDPTNQNHKSRFDSLGITDDDLDHMSSSGEVQVPRRFSPGDEFQAEIKSLQSTPEADEMYLKALSFLEKGRGHGVSAKKAAYHLIDQASQAGNRDAQKLMAFAHLFGDRARWSLDESRRLFQELAEYGSPDAQLGLGFMHATGLGMSKSDQAKAVVYYTFSALGGNPLAQMAMAYRYYSGIGVPLNCETALSYYQKVADKVAANVQFSTSQTIQRIRLTDENEPTTSSNTPAPMDQNVFDYYKFLAEKGDTSAQVGLGQLFLTGGRGVEQNFEQASKYFTTAAEAGHAGAFAHLGKMYLEGTPVTPQDNTTAFQFFLKSADKNNYNGQAGLGIMFLQGRGVKRDLEKAFKLFTLAAEQGGADGQLYLGEMYFKGIGVKRDFKTAIKFFQMASQNGQVLAFYNLGVMHASGTGVARSCSLAVDLFKSVAERGRWTEKIMEAYAAYKEGRHDEAAMKYMFLAELGYEHAQTNVAYILDRGEADSLFSQPREDVLGVAIVQWQRSANQEYSPARIKLGDYHYYGWGTPVDYTLAAQQYKTAVDRHLAPQAMFNLGFMHQQGLGLNKDLYLAKRFYDMAAEHSTDAIVPVTLALANLAIVYVSESITQSPLVKLLESYIGPFWDLFFMLLCGIITIFIFVRVFNRNR